MNGRLEIVLESPSTHWLVSYAPVGVSSNGHCVVDGFTRAQCDLPTGSWNVMLFGSDAEYGKYEYLGNVDVNSR